MKKPKILVYMATYNGENFIKEQLDSILTQENVLVDILVADDCSTDRTCQIVESYQAGNITLLRNPQNKGYRRNFWDLIQRPLEEEYDYFALADQDDVWLPGKLDAAVQKLREFPLEEASLYCSNLKLVDSTLQSLGSNLNRPVKPDPHAFILQNICTGCTAVFNNALRDLLLRFPAKKLIVPHDTVISRVALLCGNFVYDETPYILYRQHGNNQIGVNNTGKLKKYWNAVRNRQSFPHSENLRDIWERYQQEISLTLAIWLQPLLDYKTSVRSKLRLVFSSSYCKRNLIATFIFKCAILLKTY